MTENTNSTPIQKEWRNFVNNVNRLLVPQVNDRPLDQYLEFRDTVLALVEGELFLTELNGTWTSPTSSLPPGISEALLLEMNAFSRAVEIMQATQNAEEQRQGQQKQLSRASTVVGSVKDLLANLPPYAKAALTLFGELLDLFKA